MMKDSTAEYRIKYAKRKYKRVPLDLPLEMYASIKALCDARGEPVNAYIKRLIQTDMQATEIRSLISSEQL